ncbi:MAG TPA: RAMP superfamily CRISPR-associated protein [Candidatus Brocadiaceae bacterium]|nr:RAMP superfamily CRISPR-associated protein [Candidatus Brocadiaceae bacterium]
MASIRLKLTTQSPLLVAAGPPSHNLIETLDFIPGNTIRGFLAQRYIDQKKQTGDVFHRLFLSGQIRFGFAFINGSQVIPLSAYSCKYTGGFENDKGHGITDMLQGGSDTSCQNCKKPLDRFEGFWNPSKEKEEKVKKRLITRTAIDPVLGCAGSGQLYSQRVIEEGQAFFTNIEVPDDLASELICLISNPFVACIGTGRSRGQGWIEVKPAAPEYLSKNDTAKERFQRFKSKVLAVTLLSDAIFHDVYLRDCTAPDVSHLEPLGIDANDWEPVLFKAFAASRMVFGFDGIPLQLPRVPRLSVSAGSVFLFKAKGGREPVVPDGNGIGWIGDNNGEGFGHAVLWHTFHIRQEKEAVL